MLGLTLVYHWIERGIYHSRYLIWTGLESLIFPGYKYKHAGLVSWMWLLVFGRLGRVHVLPG